MNKIIVRYQQVDFDRTHEIHTREITTSEHLYNIKRLKCSTCTYTHVEIVFLDDEEFPVMTEERVVPSHRLGTAIFNSIKNELFYQGMAMFFRYNR